MHAVSPYSVYLNIQRGEEEGEKVEWVSEKLKTRPHKHLTWTYLSFSRSSFFLYLSAHTYVARWLVRSKVYVYHIQYTTRYTDAPLNCSLQPLEFRGRRLPLPGPLKWSEELGLFPWRRRIFWPGFMHNHCILLKVPFLGSETQKCHETLSRLSLSLDFIIILD